MKLLIGAARASRVFDLAQPYFVGMPHFPSHPPFSFSLTRLHGDTVLPGDGSSCSDAIAMSGHTGTHMDALGHFSCGGHFFGGAPVKQSYHGLESHAISDVPPIVRRGVLLDIAKLIGVPALEPEFTITTDHLERACERGAIKIERGDVVLLRTGWAQYFREPVRFYNGTSPGPEIEGARWLSEKGAYAVGSDTLTFERVPNPAMPVHIHLLVEKGIHIIEVLQLEELARENVPDFLFTAAPLRIEGGTGAPIRPIAIVEPA